MSNLDGEKDINVKACLDEIREHIEFIISLCDVIDKEVEQREQILDCIFCRD